MKENSSFFGSSESKFFCISQFELTSRWSRENPQFLSLTWMRRQIWIASRKVFSYVLFCWRGTQGIRTPPLPLYVPGGQGNPGDFTNHPIHPPPYFHDSNFYGRKFHFRKKNRKGRAVTAFPIPLSEKGARDARENIRIERWYQR